MSEEEVFSVIGSRMRAALRDLPFCPSKADLAAIARAVAAVGIALCQRAGVPYGDTCTLCESIYREDPATTN